MFSPKNMFLPKHIFSPKNTCFQQQKIDQMGLKKSTK